MTIAGRLSCAAAGALTAAAVLAGAQDPQEPTFRLEANYVRVDMYATRGNEAVDDLALEDVELFEDGARQAITAFEHVKVRPSVVSELRRDPASPSASRDMARDPRVRVLVVFLDTFHVQLEGSHAMRAPLVELIEKTLGDDDLVAVMHPRMSARDAAFGRRTTVISRLLEKNWTWGERFRDTNLDPVEEQWVACYGLGERFRQMQARRREAMALDALSDLVIHLRGLREERKAVLLVTEGWELFGPNPKLAELQSGEAPPSGRGVFVGPTGKLQTRDPQQQRGGSKTDCDAARIQLAHMDNQRRIHDLAGDANRGNVTFYTMHPRGLQVADSPLVTHRTAAEFQGSMKQLISAQNQLKELATNTDGLAVTNTNDLGGAMRRIVDDLTSYYLLGYYSTNAKADGRYRSISVRVKRPGVQVRARRGYRALTEEEAATLRAARPAPSPPTAAATARPANTVLRRPDDRVSSADLASLRHAVLLKRGPSTGREYVHTQDPRVRRTDRLRVEHAANGDGAPSARMLDGQGRPMAVPVQASERADPAGAHRWLVADVTLAPLAPGDYAIELTVGETKVVTPFRVVP